LHLNFIANLIANLIDPAHDTIRANVTPQLHRIEHEVGSCGQTHARSSDKRQTLGS